MCCTESVVGQPACRSRRRRLTTTEVPATYVSRADPAVLPRARLRRDDTPSLPGRKERRRPPTTRLVEERRQAASAQSVDIIRACWGHWPGLVLHESEAAAPFHSISGLNSTAPRLDVSRGGHGQSDGKTANGRRRGRAWQMAHSGKCIRILMHASPWPA